MVPNVPWHRAPAARGPCATEKIFKAILLRHWDSRQKVAVNVTDKLITLLLMLILSTVLLVFSTLNI